MLPSDERDGRLSLLLVSLVALGLAIPSFSVGLLSDDFSWLRIVRGSAGMDWSEYLGIPSPYGYFRPVPMAVFRVLGLSLPGAVWPFRVLVVSLHSANCLLVYLLGRRLGADRRAALFASLLFAVLPCHAESLFWVSALNEPLASFLVMSGLAMLLWHRPTISGPLSTLLFTAALATRESAFCYLPLILLLTLLQPRLRTPALIPVLLLPGAIYLGLRLWWSASLPPGTPVSSPGELSLNPFEVGRRLSQYLVSLALPVKSLFHIAGYGRYELLRRVLASPAMSPWVFWTISVSGTVLLILALWLCLRRLGRGLLAPLAFTVLALGVYLPFRNTSEHFLYFPSIGICFILGLSLARAWGRRAAIGLGLFLVLFSVYAVSRVDRLYRWRQASLALGSTVSQLDNMTSDIPDRSRVLVEGLNNRYYGIPFVGEHSLNDAWSWLRPGRHLSFYFDRSGNDRYLLRYDPGTFAFERVR